MKDVDLIEKIQKEDCNESLKVLYERYVGLCVKVVKSYEDILKNSCEDYDLLTNNKQYLVYQAAKTYKQDRDVLFSTWLYTKVRFLILAYVSRQKKKYYAFGDEALDILESKNLNEERIKQENKGKKEGIIEVLLFLKDKRIYKIFNYKYSNYGYNHKDIALKMNMSVSNVGRLHRVGIKHLRKRLKKI
jgi:DNA-directed RNA polymerase specialized sigma24 family protein